MGEEVLTSGLAWGPAPAAAKSDPVSPTHILPQQYLRIAASISRKVMI